MKKGIIFISLFCLFVFNSEAAQLKDTTILGNCGIGTTTPATELHVLGTATVTAIVSTISPSLQKHYAQLSSSVNQFPGTTSPTLILFNTQDKIQGITHSTISNTGSITVNRTGMYFIIAGGQVDKTGGGSALNVDVWFRKNGTDIANSNVRNTIMNINDTKVVISQYIVHLSAGEYINVMQSVDDAAQSGGLRTMTPSGEAVIPSIIFSMYEM